MIVAAFVASGIALALVSLLGIRWPSKFPAIAAVADSLPVMNRGIPGAESGFNANAVAGTLILFIPLQAALIFRGHLFTKLSLRVNRLAHGAALGMTGGVLLLTQSRGAWLSLLLSVIAVFSLAALGTRSRRPKAWVSATTFAVVASVGAVTASSGGPAAWEQLRVGTPGARIELWSRAVEVLADFPLTGVGLNGFRRVMPIMYPTVLTPDSPTTDVAHAHNQFLQAGLDLGILGLVAYTALWMTIGTLIWSIMRNAHHAEYHAMGLALACGLGAQFLFGMVDTIPLGSKLGVAFWTTLGLAIGLEGIVTGPSQGTSGPSSQAFYNLDQ